jgi:hypothetical protein
MDMQSHAEHPRSPFYEHLKAAGSMTRTNPELKRLSEETGYSTEHLFKVATGRRGASRPLAVAISKATRNKAVRPETFKPVTAK